MQEEHYRPISVLSSTGIPAKLRMARARSGKSQKDLAAEIGVTPRHLRFMEDGSRDADKHVPRIAKATDLPIGWFYGEVS